jgi:hypothetical protein
MIPQLYSPTPAHSNRINYIKLIISKIVFKQKIVWRKKFQAHHSSFLKQDLRTLSTKSSTFGVVTGLMF